MALIRGSDKLEVQHKSCFPVPSHSLLSHTHTHSHIHTQVALSGATSVACVHQAVAPNQGVLSFVSLFPFSCSLFVITHVSVVGSDMSCVMSFFVVCLFF